jgi:hypothetical protein
MCTIGKHESSKSVKRFALWACMGFVACGAPSPSGDGGQRLSDGGVLVEVDAGCPAMELVDGGCIALAFSRLCDLPHVTVLQSGVTLDDEASRHMATALTSHCAPPLMSATADTRDGGGGWLDAQGAPVVGRNQNLIAAGGTFTQPFVNWYERTGRAPVFETSAGANVSLSTRAGEVLFTEPLANLGPHLDYFVVEFVRSVTTGPLSVIGYGFYAPGTTAAAWFFEHRVLTQPLTSTDNWYVVRWTDVDGNTVPNEADQFTILRAGN